MKSEPIIADIARGGQHLGGSKAGDQLLWQEAYRGSIKEGAIILFREEGLWEASPQQEPEVLLSQDSQH